MFGSSVCNQSRANRPADFDPMARAFVPAAVEESDYVCDATFTTNTMPDIPPNSHIVGLCTVPHEQAGMDNLGWHITDFLAFKYLLHDEVHRGSQDWLAHCDVVSIVNRNPNAHVHGKERRIILDAEGIGQQGTSYSHGANLKVQTDRQKLMADFLIACSVKAHLSKQSNTPLFIVVCGPTTLEQDIFFGETSAVSHLKSQTICHAIGGDVEAIMVTPAMFSAGWQINPSFTRPPHQVRADRSEFLAKQFGGIFTTSHISHFAGSACPFLNGNDTDKKEVDELLEPFLLSNGQRVIIADLKEVLHHSLAGRLSVRHGVHSFNFETEHDDWEKLIGPRKHLSLKDYRAKWEKLGVSALIVNHERFGFLGDAFGGNKMSQLSHLKHLIKESFEAWPGYWELPASDQAKSTFKRLLNGQDVDENVCHEMFNILEHHATLAVLGDITVRSLDLPNPTQDRCRDWNEKVDFISVKVPYTEIREWIPGVFVPSGVNLDEHRYIQKYFDYPVLYLALAVVRHCTHTGESIRMITMRIHNFLEAVKSRQIELLHQVPEVEQKCIEWLNAINKPIRHPGKSSAAVSQLEAPIQVTVEGGKTIQQGPRPQPEPERLPQPPSQLRRILVGAMLDGQSIAGVPVGQKTETEVNGYFVKNFEAQEALDFLLKKEPGKAMQSLIKSHEKLNESIQEGPNDSSQLLIKQDIDFITEKFLINWLEKSKERNDRVNDLSNLNPGPVAAVLQQVSTPQPAVTRQQTPQAASQQGSEQQASKPGGWIPPHLRGKIRNVAETAKENNLDMASYQGSTPMGSSHDQPVGNQASNSTPRAGEQGEKKLMRIDVETLMRRHYRRNDGGGA
ncbi:hypothetical protein F4805DRAFT_477815 [Annulohypoxylon moriforme]|nr:hypothetical protein F4805DRAFT_477815 [Annulohypoxylon moriforme]